MSMSLFLSLSLSLSQSPPAPQGEDKGLGAKKPEPGAGVGSLLWVRHCRNAKVQNSAGLLLFFKNPSIPHPAGCPLSCEYQP